MVQNTQNFSLCFQNEALSTLASLYQNDWRQLVQPEVRKFKWHIPPTLAFVFFAFFRLRAPECSSGCYATVKLENWVTTRTLSLLARGHLLHLGFDKTKQTNSLLSTTRPELFPHSKFLLSRFYRSLNVSVNVSCENANCWNTSPTTNSQVACVIKLVVILRIAWYRFIQRCISRLPREKWVRAGIITLET